MKIGKILFNVSCIVFLFIFNLLILTSTFYSKELFAQDDHEHDHGHKPKTSALEGFKKKVERLPSLGRFAQDLRNICSALEKDGRRAFFYEVAVKNSEKDPKCLQCKDFFKLLAKACIDKNAQKKIKKTKKKKVDDEEESSNEESQTATPSPSAFGYAKQRYPNVDVLEAANQLGTKMALNKDLVGGYYDLLNIFISKLKENNQISPGLMDYLDHFENALFSAFAEYKNFLSSEVKKKKDRENAKIYKPEDDSEGIDLLFE